MDHSHTLSEIINGYFQVSSNPANRLIGCTEVVEVQKDRTFIKIDTFNDFDYFLLNGICRSFIVNHKGESISISFFQDRTILTPNIARTFNNQSTLNFEALTDITLARFKAIELVKLMREISEMRDFANAVLQKELILKSKKELSNASVNAKERLIRFREEFNSLENLIPHPLIASYLGITNISLSRIRKELANENY